MALVGVAARGSSEGAALAEEALAGGAAQGSRWTIVTEVLAVAEEALTESGGAARGGDALAVEALADGANVDGGYMALAAVALADAAARGRVTTGSMIAEVLALAVRALAGT